MHENTGEIHGNNIDNNEKAGERHEKGMKRHD